MLVIGRNKAAHAVFGAAVADHHQVTGNARCAGDGVGLGGIESRGRPQQFALLRIQRLQSAIDGGDKYHSAIDRHATVDHVTAGVDAFAGRNFRIVLP